MRTTKMIVVMLLLSLSLRANIQTSGDDVIGVWLVGSTEAKVTIFKTGTYYYGKISWLKYPNDENGKPKLDVNNLEKTAQTKPVMGLLLLKGFEFNTSNNSWEKGTIYDPKNGKTYSCKMHLTNQQTLEVRGYIGISMIGRTEIWTKAD